jgi:glycerol-3-phosphate dehydrogenase (NAD(P)+)
VHADAPEGAGLRVTVVGGGSWGTAFADLLVRRGHRVTLAFRDAAQAAAVQQRRENARYLPGVRVADGLRAEPLDPVGSVTGRDLVVLAVPSRAFADTCRLLAPQLDRAVVLLSLTKGLEPGSGRRLSAVAAAEAGVGEARVAVLSGPTHAEEVARGAPAAATVAASDDALAARLQAVAGGPRFRLYAGRDVVGVELCAAAKNVIALAAGVSDGLGYGDNAKAGLITRGLAELSRLGAAFGADARTFAGLAGLGDLVATCCSGLSRNRRAGELLAAGVPSDRLEAEVGMIVEGVTTAPTLRALAAGRGLELPIVERVCAVLAGEPPAEAVGTLMARDPSPEY